MSAATRHHSLKEKQRRERADLILHAAEEVLIEKGFVQSSIDEIAARVASLKARYISTFEQRRSGAGPFQASTRLFLDVVVQSVHQMRQRVRNSNTSCNMSTRNCPAARAVAAHACDECRGAQ